MLEGIRRVFRPKPKKKSGGRSSKTRPVSFRLDFESYDKLVRRAIRYCGGDLAWYISIKLDLHRNHHKKRERRD
jgi:hypothetical protein